MEELRPSGRRGSQELRSPKIPDAKYPPKSLDSDRHDRLHLGICMDEPKCIVYVLRTVGDPTRYYTGVTSDVDRRLTDHHAGRCPHTAGGRPWQVDVLVHFADQQRALKLERYLKSGSGCAFAKRHLR